MMSIRLSRAFEVFDRSFAFPNRELISARQQGFGAAPVNQSSDLSSGLKRPERG
jgi:hypothetical protein